LLAVVFGIKAIYVQREFGAIGEKEIYSITQKICFASYSIWAYLGKLLVPINLSTFYPYPWVKNGMPEFYSIAPFLLIVAAIAVFFKFRKNRTVVFGLLFFLVPLSLTLQFVSVGNAIMADRYTYVPYIGMFFMVGMGYQQLRDNKKGASKYVLYAASVLIYLFGILFIGITYQRCKVWKNSETLWTDVISKFPQHPTGHFNRASYFEKGNQFDKAITDYTNAIALNPAYYEAYFSRGNIYFRKKVFDSAIEDYTKAIEIKPSSFDAYHNRSVVYGNMNNRVKALEDENKAIELGQPPDKIYMDWLRQ
jgi:tetratricopeptide (TPR) repeat protein